MDSVTFAGVVCVLIGVIGTLNAARWLRKLRDPADLPGPGTSPRLPNLRMQRILAWWMIAWEASFFLFGLALLFVPGVRAFVRDLLGW